MSSAFTLCSCLPLRAGQSVHDAGGVYQSCAWPMSCCGWLCAAYLQLACHAYAVYDVQAAHDVHTVHEAAAVKQH